MVSKDIAYMINTSPDSRELPVPFLSFKMMKIFFMVAITAGAWGLSELPEEMKEMAKVLHDDCLETTGADPAALKACETGTFADDPKLKCYFKCIYQQIGAISEDDKLDADAFLSILPPELSSLEKSINACKGTEGSDGCDLAMKFNMCIYNKDPASFLVI